MNTKRKIILESKLKVYLTYYEEAERRKDQERMDKLGIFIDGLREEIHELE